MHTLKDKTHVELATYNGGKSFSSFLFPNPSIKFLRQISLSTDINSEGLIDQLLKHAWNQEDKVTATDRCVSAVLVHALSMNDVHWFITKIKNCGIHPFLNNRDVMLVIQSYGQYAAGIVRALALLHSANLLTQASAQANFDAITHAGGLHAWGIGDALVTLGKAGLLIGNGAQANRDAIIQGGAKYANNIARALAILSQAGLLNGDDAQANRNTIIQGGGQYTEDMARALVTISRVGLLAGHDAQANCDAIAQVGGQYAKDIAESVTIVRGAGLLTKQRMQANFEAITQGGGQYAKAFANALHHLRYASLLKGESGQANFEVLTQRAGQYAKDIGDALSAVSVLRGDNVRLCFEMIQRCGGQHAKAIAAAQVAASKAGLLASDDSSANDVAIAHMWALATLDKAGLLKGAEGEANRQAITQFGGQYAYIVACALNVVKAAGLLTGERAQENFFNFYTRMAIGVNNGHGASRFLELIESMAQDHQLDQDSWDLFFEVTMYRSPAPQHLATAIDLDQHKQIPIVTDDKDWQVFNAKVFPYLSHVLSKETQQEWRKHNSHKSVVGLWCEILELCEFVPGLQFSRQSQASYIVHSLLDCMLVSPKASIHFLSIFLSMLKSVTSDPSKVENPESFMVEFLMALNRIWIVLTYAEKAGVENTSDVQRDLMDIFLAVSADHLIEDTGVPWVDTVVKVVNTIKQLSAAVAQEENAVAAISSMIREINQQLDAPEVQAPVSNLKAVGSIERLASIDITLGGIKVLSSPAYGS